MSDIDISVILVSWNVSELVLACLESIFLAAKGLKIEVVVIDNNSSDNTVEEIQARFPQVRLIVNKDNVGFAVATNQGLTISRGRYIFLLNPDTVVLEDTLAQMVRFADAHEEVGLLGPRVQSADGEIQEVCARSFPTPLSWFWYYSLVGQVFRGSKVFANLYMTYWDHKTSRPVDALAGAAMWMPRRTFEEVGFLDQTHPMYFEDLDYCFRVGQTGRTIYYLAEAIVIHYGGQSSKQLPKETKILILEAHRLFFQRYGNRWDPFLFRLAAVGVFLIRLPVLGIVKLWASLRSSDSPKVRRISLMSEIVTFLWGIGLLRQPDIVKMRV